MVARAQTVTLNELAPAVAYIELNALKADIPADTLVQALDENGDGAIDGDVWTEIQVKVGEEIDGTLGQRYATPFADPLPAIVKLAARAFAIEAIYAKRSLLNEKSPERINAKNIRAKLSAIADGAEPLMPGKDRARPSGSVIKESARTNSDRPAI